MLSPRTIATKNVNKFISNYLLPSCCAPLAFIFPSWMHMKLCNPTGIQLYFDWFLFVFGLGAWVVATWASLASDVGGH
jgi:hypothetical protein